MINYLYQLIRTNTSGDITPQVMQQMMIYIIDQIYDGGHNIQSLQLTNHTGNTLSIGLSGTPSVVFPIVTSSLSGIMTNTMYDNLIAAKNPYYTLKFSGIDGDTDTSAIPGEFGMYNASGNQIQGVSSVAAAISYIENAKYMSRFGDDPTNPSTDLLAVNTGDYFEARAIGGGRVVYSLTEVSSNQSMIIVFNTCIKNDVAGHPSYTMNNIETIIGDIDLTGISEGVYWKIVCNDRMSIEDLIDLNLLVQKKEIEDRDTDRYYSYNNAFIGNTYRKGDMCLYTGTDDPTDDTNAIRNPDLSTLADGNYRLLITTYPRTDRDPNNAVFVSTPETVSDYPLNEILYQTFYNSLTTNKLNHTVNGTPVLHSTGDGQYLSIPVSVVRTGDIREGVEGEDYTQLAREVPLDFKARFPWNNILDAPWLNPLDFTNAANITQASSMIIETSNGWQRVSLAHLGEHVQPITTAPRKVALHWENDLSDIDAGNLKVGWQNAINQSTKIGQLKMSLPASVNLIGGGALPIAEIEKILNLHHKLTISNSDESFKITGTITNFFTSFGERYVNIQNASQAGTQTDGEALTLLLESNLVGRDEFAAVAFSGAGSDVSIDASGFDGNLSTDDDTVQKVAQKVDDLNLGENNSDYFVAATNVGGTANAITLSNTGITAYEEGQRFVFVSKGSPTSATTINIDSLGIKNVVREDNTAIQTSDILTGLVLDMVYDGTRFRLMNRHLIIPTEPTTTQPSITATETANTWDVIASSMTGKSFEFSMIYDQNGSGNWGYATTGRVMFNDMADNHTRKHWVPRPADSGARVQLNRNGSNLRAQLAGTIANVSATLIVYE